MESTFASSSTHVPQPNQPPSSPKMPAMDATPSGGKLPKLCWTCDSWFHTGSLSLLRVTGSWLGFMTFLLSKSFHPSPTCAVCIYLSKYKEPGDELNINIFVEDVFSHPTIPSLVKSKPIRQELRSFTGFISSVRFPWSNDEYYELVSFKAAYTTDSEPRFVSIEPVLLKRKFDPGVAKTWLHSLCDKKCIQQSFTESESIHKLPENLRLISLDDMCLVDYSNQQYVAVSYMWEDGNNILQLNADTNKNGEFYKPGFFNHALVPPLLKDCMSFCRELGYHYLWIDRYCILQDDDDERHSQIKAMHAIYSQTDFTLMCAIDDKNPSGLPGYRIGRSASSPFLELGGDIYPPVSLSGLERGIVKSQWNTRGWTFQERLLSPRRLYVGDNCIAYECNCSIELEHFSLLAEHNETPSFIYRRNRCLCSTGDSCRRLFSKLISRFTAIISEGQRQVNLLPLHIVYWLETRRCMDKHYQGAATKWDVEPLCFLCQKAYDISSVTDSEYPISALNGDALEFYAALEDYGRHYFCAKLETLVWTANIFGLGSQVSGFEKFCSDVPLVASKSPEECREWLLGRNGEIVRSILASIETMTKEDFVRPLLSFCKISTIVSRTVQFITDLGAKLRSNVEACKEHGRVYADTLQLLHEKLDSPEISCIQSIVQNASAWINIHKKPVDAWFAYCSDDSFHGSWEHFRGSFALFTSDENKFSSDLESLRHQIKAALRYEDLDLLESETTKILSLSQTVFKEILELADSVTIEDTATFMSFYLFTNSLAYHKTDEFESRPLNSFYDYADLVQSYTGRSLTDPTDSLNAVSGALSTLGNRPWDSFICGFMKEFFINSLFWCPDRTSKETNDLLPSWSWGHVLTPTRYLFSWDMDFQYMCYIGPPNDPDVEILNRCNLNYSKKVSLVKNYKDFYREHFITRAGKTEALQRWAHPLLVTAEIYPISVFLLRYFHPDIIEGSSGLANATLYAIGGRDKKHLIILRSIGMIPGVGKVFKRIGRVWDFNQGFRLELGPRKATFVIV